MPTVLRKLNIELLYRNVDELDELLKFYREFAKGGGLSPLQVDQVEQQLLDAYQVLALGSLSGLIEQLLFHLVDLKRR